MNTTTLNRDSMVVPPVITGTRESSSAVSWGAIFAGAAGAASLSLILLALGSGLGLSSVSPWAQDGVTAMTFGVSTILWLTLTQVLASGLGGYIAGRLRTKWAGTHEDEVYFRDTAHGFLAWAIATLVTAAVLTSAVTSALGTGVQAGAALAGAAGAAGAAAAATGARSNTSDVTTPGLAYFTDGLFRRDAGASSATTDASSMQPTNGEVTRIFVESLRTGSLSAEDMHYVGQLVVQRTGLSQPDAEKRVTDGYARVKAAADDAANKAKEATDKARKTVAYASLWLFISLLIGAFSASLAATFGGRQRDLI
jgi:hypothetical protein